MRKLAIVFLSVAGLCGPFAANAALVQNSPVAHHTSQDTSSVIAVSGARDVANGLTYQVSHLNGEVSALQQQLQSILPQPTVMAQAPAPLFPESVGG